MRLARYMKRDVVSIHADATIRDAARVFVRRRIGLLPVIDKNEKLIGAVSLQDMLTLELPDFVNFVTDVDFVHDFGAVETTRPSAATLGRPIKKLMQPPVAVAEDCGLLRAYALMIQHKLNDLLVVSAEGGLVGVASRVDIGRAILSSWANVEE